MQGQPPTPTRRCAEVARETAETAIRAALDLDGTGVADVAIVGLPDEHSGEQVVAAVVVEDGADVDPEALRAFARSEMAAYKAPRRIEFVDELPRSLIGKVLRRQVRERLQQA